MRMSPARVALLAHKPLGVRAERNPFRGKAVDLAGPAAGLGMCLPRSPVVEVHRMFALPRRSRRLTRLPRVRPQLERLETRDCPAAPVITLTATPTTGRMVHLAGQVTDE